MVNIYDSFDEEYKSPFGAIVTDESCTFKIKLLKSEILDLPPIMVIFRYGFKEIFLAMNETDSKNDYTEYSCTFTPKQVGVYFYYFVLANKDTRRYIKKTDAHTGIIGEGELFQLTVSDKDFKTPDFIKGGIIYQIFPDRFYKSNCPHENVPSDRIIRDDWGGTPLYKPDQTGHVRNNDYFCGDLCGIAEKLPYLKSLGINMIYLNPIFESHENHRYNTADYMKVDPLLGTDEDVKILCKKASEYNISIILDGVFSHTGADSVYFNKFARYDEVGAYQSKKSKYYSWYTFTEFPEKYDSWWGIDTLPNVTETNKDYNEFICGKNGVLNYWLSMGAKGFRLDVADELPDAFIDNLRKCVKQNSSDNFIIGEVWEDASNKESYGVKRKYLLGEQLDSTMNYPFKSAILNYIKGNISEHDFKNSIMCIYENYPTQAMNVMMNLISSHDSQRAISFLGGESIDGKSKEWQETHILSKEEYETGKKLLKLCMVLEFYLPGVPTIYYGDEAGLEGDKDPFNRKCYPWGKEDSELIGFVKNLCTLRINNTILKKGKFRFLYDSQDVIAFERYSEDKKTIVVINKGESDKQLDLSDICIKNYSYISALYGKLQENKKILIPQCDFCILDVSIG